MKEKGRGRINASLETPAALMYIQENRKRVTNLLKTCQMAFNHGAAGLSAKEEHRSKISSGPSALQTSGAVPFWSFVCCVIEFGGQISLFF